MKLKTSPKEFRVWDSRTGTLSYFSIRDTYGHIPSDIPDEDIEQSIGRSDINGTPIFEGDIVRCHRDTVDKARVVSTERIGPYEIIWCQIMSSFGLGKYAPDNQINDWDLEIIGNKHQNKEIVCDAWD